MGAGSIGDVPAQVVELLGEVGMSARRHRRRFGKVAVLMGGTSAEREISLLSGTGVLAALRSQGVDAQAFDPAERELGELKREGFARCFIALHGRHGEDGSVQGALELLGIPYTGSGVMASAIAHRQGDDQARLARRGPADAALRAPGRRRSRAREQLRAVPDVLGLPLIVKPPREGSSIGITKVAGYSQMQGAVELAARYDADVLCEEFIDGDELTCPVLGEGSAARGAAGRSHRRARRRLRLPEQVLHRRRPLRVPERPAGRRRSARSSASSWPAYRTARLPRLGPRRPDAARAADRKPFLLEMNTSPGMTSHSLVPMSARAAGISYEALCLRAARRRDARLGARARAAGEA